MGTRQWIANGLSSQSENLLDKEQGVWFSVVLKLAVESMLCSHVS